MEFLSVTGQGLISLGGNGHAISAHISCTPSACVPSLLRFVHKVLNPRLELAGPLIWIIPHESAIQHTS